MSHTQWRSNKTFDLEDYFERKEIGDSALEDLPLWRYMTITKFINLISSEQLYFCPAIKFEDPYEGCMSRYAYEKIRDNISYSDATKKMMFKTFNNARKSPVSCWHISNNESEAMWKLYSQDKQGIAIQTTSSSLIESLTIYPEREHFLFRAGLVRYIDHDIEEMPGDPLFTKRVSYAHEKEFRLCFLGSPDNVEEHNLVECDIENMIHAVHVSPWADKQYLDAVKYICSTKNLQFTPTPSTLMAAPKWYD